MSSFMVTSEDAVLQEGNLEQVRSYPCQLDLP